MKIVKFGNHYVALNSIESGTNVYEKNPGMIARGVQMLEKSVEEACNSILCPSFSLVGKLVRVQPWADDWENDVQY